MIIEYNDANNQEYTGDIKLRLPLYTTSEAKRYGMVKGNGTVGVLIIIAIVAGGFFFYRRRKKKKGFGIKLEIKK